MSELRVGVPESLLALSSHTGHGKVWRRALAHLGEQARVVALEPRSGRPTRRRAREPHVVLANGHAELPCSPLPLVVQIHEAGWFDDELRETIEPAFLDYTASRTEIAVGAATRIIVPSEAARRDLVAAYRLQPERVHPIPHGVDEVFRPTAWGGRALVAEARAGSDAPYILYAAALHPRKNLAVLRDAVAGLAAEGFPHVLAVAGSAPIDRQDSAPLERAAGAELSGVPGRVVRVRDPDDGQLAGLMAEADAFCLPSLYEGFGLTVVEAMACETPVVVSDRGSLPEVVGNAGVVVAPTADAVRDALRSLLVDAGESRRLARAGAERAAGFTWSRTGRGWLSVLRQAAGRP